MPDSRLRFALSGAGAFSRVFARYICEVGEIVSVCDPSAESLALFREHTGLDIPVYREFEPMLDEMAVDAVAVLGPNHTHRGVTVSAAQRGKHVYCEKPMATTVSDCRDMAQACDAAGVRLMVGHKRRLRPPWARMIELRSELGPVHTMNVCLYHDARPYDFRGWWTRAAECGGTLDIAGVHTIDWMRAMCGDVATVSAMAGPQIDRRYDFPDNLHVSLQFHSGAVAVLTVSLSYPLLRFRESNGPLIVYQQGGVRFLPQMTHIDLYWQKFSDTGSRHERFDDLGFDHAYRKELGDFVRWVTAGVEPCLTWREGLRCVEVIEAAHTSAAQNGKCITLSNRTPP
jgi:predicted dehydrogenase